MNGKNSNVVSSYREPGNVESFDRPRLKGTHHIKEFSEQVQVTANRGGNVMLHQSFKSGRPGNLDY